MDAIKQNREMVKWKDSLQDCGNLVDDAIIDDCRNWLETSTQAITM